MFYSFINLHIFFKGIHNKNGHHEEHCHNMETQSARCPPSAKRFLQFDSLQQSKKICITDDYSVATTSGNIDSSKCDNCICTCCNSKQLRRKQCLIFRISRYDMNNTTVADKLSNRQLQSKTKELICKKCHNELLFIQQSNVFEHQLDSQCLRSGCVNIDESNSQPSTDGTQQLDAQRMHSGPINIAGTNSQSSNYGVHQLDAQCVRGVTTGINESNSQSLTHVHVESSSRPVRTNSNIKHVCTCCRIEHESRRKFLIFKPSVYNMANETVTEALHYRLPTLYQKELICRKCHSSLLKCHMPSAAISSPTKVRPCPDSVCVSCKEFVPHKMRTFVRPSYGINSKLDERVDPALSTGRDIICNSCHVKYIGYMAVFCVSCESNTERKNSVLVDVNKFPSHAHLVDIVTSSDEMGRRLCIQCHHKCVDMNNTCLVCTRSVPRKRSIVFDSTLYDFSQFVVARCIPFLPADDSTSYICMSCHMKLCNTTTTNPSVPKFVTDPLVVHGCNFLRSLTEFPSFPCTCCHRMLFEKTVRRFYLDEYDVTNPVVQKCLQHRIGIRMRDETDMSAVISAEQNMLRVQCRDYICNGTIDVPEYICIRCRNALKRKKPVVPDQACANGLQLYIIPDELSNMYPIERRVISFRIPFITLIVIRRYGGHYKVNGPPVNVPATLDQIVHMLPRMPNELQLHPLKLKRKLEYKSHYMYDMIRKDKIIGAIMWLKEHNTHYSSIPIDTSWLENMSVNDISVLPCTEPDSSNVDSCPHDVLSKTFTDSDIQERTSDCNTISDNEIESCCSISIGKGKCVDGPDLVIHDNDANDEVPELVIDNSDKDNQECQDSHVLPITVNSIDSVVRLDDASGSGENADDSDKSDEHQHTDDSASHELIEDQAAIDRRQDTMGDALPSVVQFDSLENIVYNCAPGENNIPKYILLDDDFEVLAFPDLFPYGYGGYNSRKSECRLPIRKYFQQRLLNIDGRFAKNMEYIFCAQYIADIQQIQSDANLAIRLARGRTLNGQRITAGVLRDPLALQQLVRTEQAYKFLKNVRGSPAYWQGELYDVLAMLKSLGIPTWFLTLSAADLHWPEMIQAIARQFGIRVPNDAIDNMSVAEKSLFLRHNPVTGVRMFLHRVENFFSKYLLSSANPIGVITDYVIKIEFQMRGSPHAHCLVWVKNAPKIDKNTDGEVCAFIDRYITGMLPPEQVPTKQDREIMLKLQHHSHSDYCRRGKKCRFGFPKAPSLRTIISRKPECEDVDTIIDNAKAVLTKVQNHLSAENSDVYNTVDELLIDAEVDREMYAQSLEISSKGPNIILRRSPRDIYINSCNPDILRLWGANVDLQYVINEVATVMYVCSYMTKGEKAMGETLKRVAKECRNDDMRTQMNKIKREFLGKRVIGAPESCMRILSSWLMKKSRKVVYVNTNMQCERVSLPKTKAQLEKLHTDDDDVFATSLLDRYGARPSTMHSTCLALFAVTYDVATRGNAGSEDSDDQSGHQQNTSRIIRLKDGLGYMRKRKVPSILRTRHFKITTEPERYYHSKLILYYPWTNENELIEGYDSFQLSYQAKFDVISDNAQSFNDECDIFDINIENEDLSPIMQSAWDLVAPSIAADDALTHKLGFTTLQHNSNVNDAQHNPTTNVPDLPTDNLSRLYEQAASRQHMGSSQYRAYIRSLNQKQKEIVMYNRQWCKTYVHKFRLGDRVNGYHIFLSGCGGTGKSHVVRLLQRDMSHLLQHILRPEPDQPIAIVTAPTGSAAYNIGGSTIHSALSINDRTKGVISFEKQCTMQIKLEHLMLLVVDEISMVGFEFFQRMNQVVTSIKGLTGENWGNICVLTVGDLFQLPPVASAPIYMPPRNVKSLNDLAPNGWDMFKLHELTEVMRQRDIEFVSALQSIRMRQPDEGSFEDNMLRKCQLAYSVADDLYPHSAVHVYAQNIYCDDWNETMLARLTGNMFSSVAIDSKKDTATNLANIKMPDKPRDTGNLRHTLRLKVGARVMLTTNVDVSDGLTNGSMGVVQHIDIDGETRSMKAILVKFDGDNVGLSAKMSSRYKNTFPSSVPIYKGQATFIVSGRKSCHASRTQFPITLAWAVTIHKCQGLTLDEIVVDMSPSKGKFSAGQAYVAFSRVRELSKLHIINYSRSQIRVSPHAEEEMMRLRSEPLVFEQPSIVCHGHSSIDILHINIAGLMNKCDDIQLDTIFKNRNVISFNETHLYMGVCVDSETLGLDNQYCIFRKDRNKNGGGIMVAVHKSLQPQEINIQTQIEIVAVRVMLGEPAVIVSTYRPPSTTVHLFSSVLCKTLSSFICDNICVVGDFNEDILLSDDKPCYLTLRDQGFKQYVTKPTRDSGSLIDHLYVSPNATVTSDVIDCYYSDHDFVLGSVSFDT